MRQLDLFAKLRETEDVAVLFPHKGGRNTKVDHSFYTHKLCSKCKKIKPVSEYKIDRDERFYYGWRYKSQCKECQRPKQNEAAERHRRRKGMKPRTKLSNEEQAKRQRDASRRHYKKHAKKERARTKAWRQANPTKQRFMEKRRRALKRNAIGSHTFAQWERLKHEYGKMCPYCQRCESDEIKLTQDHIIPLSKGGGDYIENIQPLCFSCNASKSDREIGARLETHLMRFRNE